jgi:hypothetical protein
VFSLIEDVWFAFVGWFWLTFRYRTKQKVRSILNEKYEGEYNIAGRLIGLDLIALLFGIMLIATLFIIIVTTLYKWIFK